MAARHPETTSRILTWAEDHLRIADSHLKAGRCDNAVWNVYGASYFMGMVYSRLEGSKRNPWKNMRFKTANEHMNRVKDQINERCLLRR